MSTAAFQDGHAFEAIMKAVIIYDDLDIAAKAKAALGRAVYRADEALLWAVELWRLDMLTLPPSAEAALTEAAEAHLIVLGVRHARLLPAWLLEWLEQWAVRRQVRDAALALFDGGKGDTLSVALAPELSQFAQRHGLGFIFGDVGPAENESAVFARSLRERELSVTSTLRHIMDEPTQDYYRGWGINDE
jgi:hypothetical protein